MTYLYKRPGSQNWWIRFQYTGVLRQKIGVAQRQISLGTPDRHEAEILALEHVKKHKNLLFLARQSRKIRTRGDEPEYAVGEHTTPDGGRAIASPTHVLFFDHNGVFLRQAPNEKAVSIDLSFEAEDRNYVTPKIANRTDPDQIIIDTWIKDRNPNKYDISDAQKALKDFKALVNNKPLVKCTRDDARKLVDFYKLQGNKDATVKKKIGLLASAINIALKDRKLDYNPFSGVAPEPKDSVDRLPLSEGDMGIIRENISALSLSDQALLRFIALTGCRLSEPFSIKEEFTEGGIRYVVLGEKTDTSLRRLPIPTALFSMLPTTITEPLFTGTEGAAEKRLMRFLRNTCKITDKRKVIHSLRHRAKDRLRAAGCPLDVQYQILGHEQSTVASGYGVGYPLTKIVEWIQYIGE